MKKIINLNKGVRGVKLELRKHNLHTVCEEAHCPNLGECFLKGRATFMILGNVCTRACGFCGVRSAKRDFLTLLSPDPNEPFNVAKMAFETGLRHVVITSVTRDDLKDEGASQFAKTISALRERYIPGEMPRIEVLTPDFHAQSELIEIVCSAGPDIYNHNLETVRKLTGRVRPDADYDRSLNVLKSVADNYSNIIAKSGIMVGLGETKQEVLETLEDLCNAGCRVVTIGQYLAPSKNHLPIAEYVSLELFEEYKSFGERIGIRHVFSGPYVRSSYMAEEVLAFLKGA